MPETHIINRAYQLAAVSKSLEEIRRRLAQEGYLDIDDHLASPSLRKDLAKRYRRSD